MKIVAATLVAVLCASIALAHSGATGVVKERMDGMTALAASMKSLAAMAKSGEVDAEHIESISRDLKAHAGQGMLDRFPEGSLPEVSEASPAIWKDWEKFEGLAFELETLAVELGNEASSPNLDVRQHLKAIGGVCSACHEDFRIKK